MRIIVDRVPYVVDFERWEVLRDNVYLDATAARQIIRQAITVDPAQACRK